MDLVDAGHLDVINAALFEQRETGTLCDVVFRSGGQRLRAHRCILATKSEYFRRADFRRKPPFVVNTNIARPDTVKEFLAFCYAGTVTVTQSNLDELLSLASSFGVIRLKNLLANYLVNNVNANNIFSAHKLAETYGLPDVLQHIDHVFAEAATDILISSDEALTLPFNAVVNLMNKCRPWTQLSVLSEFVYRWTNTDPNDRLHHHNQLLSIVQSNPAAAAAAAAAASATWIINVADQKSRGPKSTTMQNCRICQHSVHSVQSLRQHYKEVHNTVDVYDCNFCNCKFTFLRDFNSHMQSHFSKPPFRCPICNDVYETLSDIVKHISHTHSASKHRDGPDHAVSDPSSKLSGSVATNNLAKTSRNYRHTGEPTILRCNQRNCSYWTTQISCLQLHQLAHPRQRPFVCEVCRKSFLQRPHLRRHQWTHSTTKPLKCQLCDNYSTARQDKLREHIKRVHKVDDRIPSQSEVSNTDGEQPSTNVCNDPSLEQPTAVTADRARDEQQTKCTNSSSVLSALEDCDFGGFNFAEVDFLFDSQDQVVQQSHQQRPSASSPPLSLASDGDWFRYGSFANTFNVEEEEEEDDLRGHPRCFSLPPKFGLFDDCFDL